MVIPNIEIILFLNNVSTTLDIKSLRTAQLFLDIKITSNGTTIFRKDTGHTHRPIHTF